MKEPGQVIGIFICSKAGEPMQQVSKVRALVKEGLAGDRYATRVGAFSNVRTGIVRHVTLFSFEEFAEANEFLVRRGHRPFKASETRRNILVRGIRLGELVGKTFSVGSVTMRGVGIADPCERPSALAEKKGFREAFEGRGGIRAEILASGMIYTMDHIMIY